MLLFHRDHRTRHFPDDLLGGTTHDHSCESGFSRGPHNQEIRLRVVNGMKNFPMRLPPSDGLGPTEIFEVEPSEKPVKLLLLALHQGFFFRLSGGLTHPEIAAQERLEDREDDKMGPERL